MWLIWPAVIATVIAECTGKFSVQHDGQVLKNSSFPLLSKNHKLNSGKALHMIRIILSFGSVGILDQGLPLCEF